MTLSRVHFCVSLILLLVGACGQSYKVTDLTTENVFTSGIEGPQCDALGNVLAVNFEKNGTVGLVRPNGQVELFVALPEGSVGNSIILDASGDLLIADYTAHNILKVNYQTRSVSIFCHNPEFNQPNDLAINRVGQLFASDPNWKEGTGRLWRIDPGGSSVLLADSIGTTNGIALSPDERILYVNESVQRKIWAYDIDKDGGMADAEAELLEVGAELLRLAAEDSGEHPHVVATDREHAPVEVFSLALDRGRVAGEHRSIWVLELVQPHEIKGHRGGHARIDPGEIDLDLWRAYLHTPSLSSQVWNDRNVRQAESTIRSL